MCLFLIDFHCESPSYQAIIMKKRNKKSFGRAHCVKHAIEHYQTLKFDPIPLATRGRYEPILVVSGADSVYPDRRHAYFIYC